MAGSGLLHFTPPVIAHRGASAHAPENTMAAFRLAADQGAKWIETDVKLTRDGVPVLMHDDTLERTTDGVGAVADADWAIIAKLDAGSWFGPEFRGERVPRLRNLLELVRARNLRLNLELKPCPGRAQETAQVALDEVARFWPGGDPPVLVSSFDMESLLAAKGMRPDLRRGFLMEEWQGDWAERARACGAATLNPDESTLTPERIAGLRASGLPVLPYVVNDPARAKALMKLGVTAVFTDDPLTMIAALR